MQSYSMDLRKRVLADCDSGMRTGLVAAKYRVSASWVRRLKQRRRETGEIGPREQRHGPLPKLAGREAELSECVRRKPDATAKEVQAQLSVEVSRSTVDRMLRRLGMTFKKRRSAPPSRIGPMSPSDA